jgi:hypothetical protein
MIIVIDWIFDISSFVTTSSTSTPHLPIMISPMSHSSHTHYYIISVIHYHIVPCTNCHCYAPIHHSLIRIYLFVTSFFLISCPSHTCISPMYLYYFVCIHLECIINVNNSTTSSYYNIMLVTIASITSPPYDALFTLVVLVLFVHLVSFN